MRRLLAILAVGALALTPAVAEAAKKRGGKAKLIRVGKFRQPVYVAAAPGVGGIFVVERGGRIIRVQGGRRRVFLDIRGQVRPGGEQGLLSVAFAPDYTSTGLFYVYFTNNGGDNEIDEFSAAGGGLSAEPSSQRQVLLFNHPVNTNHNGGQLQFGPDGLLYAGTGDGGGAGDRPDNAQNPNSLLGKLLRIDPRTQGGRPYTSPPGNPFANGGGRPEVYSLGLRNPFRFSFDFVSSPGEPRIVIGDVGQDRFEEIDYETLAAANGANFGWNDFEGFAPFDGAHSPGPGRHDRPIKVYRLSGSACALIGGYVVADRKLKGLFRRYLYGDFCVGKIRSLTPRLGGARKDRGTGLEVPMLSSFGEGPNGKVYATSLNGPVYRLARRR
jgi:glucose/arabinose dehydrogenase